MKTVFNIFVLAVLLVIVPSPCFALWDPVSVSKEEAKKLGLDVRSKAAGANAVAMELEFKTDGNLKNFSRVYLKFGADNTPGLNVALREDRSKPGCVVVSFSADRGLVDKLTLTVEVPFRDGGAGGTFYILKVKDFVEPKKDR
jgi:hypothetical protein